MSNFAADKVELHIKIIISILCFILCIITILEIIHSLKQTYCPNFSLSLKSLRSNTRKQDATSPTAISSQQLSTHKLTRNSTMIGIICYGLSLFVCSMYTFLITLIPITRRQELIIGLISATLYFIGRWCMLFIFVLRIDITFRGSIFEYPSCLIRTLHLMLFIFIIIIALIITGFLDIINPNLKLLALHIRVLSTIVWAILDFLLSTLLIILFLRKLFYLFVREMQYSAAKEKSRASSNDYYHTQDAIQHNVETGTEDDGSNDEDEQEQRSDMDVAQDMYTIVTNTETNTTGTVTVTFVEENLNERDDLKAGGNDNDDSGEDVAMGYQHGDIHYREAEMLIAMTRYTLLVSIAIVSSAAAIVMCIIVDYGYYICVIMAVEAFINGLCLYLFNRFSYKVYNVICNYPHRLCESLCIECIFCCNKL